MFLKLSAFSRQLVQYNLEVDGITEVVGVMQLYILYLKDLFPSLHPTNFSICSTFSENILETN